MSSKELIEQISSSIKRETDLAARAFVRESIQQPINGVIELAGTLSKHKLPELHLVEDDKGQANEFSVLIGSTLGKTVDFLLLNRLAHGKLAPKSDMTDWKIFGKGFAYGAFSGGLLTPVESTGEEFWSRRLSDALISGGTFGLGSLAGLRGAKYLNEAATPGEVTRLSTQMGSLLSYGALNNDPTQQLKELWSKPLSPDGATSASTSLSTDVRRLQTYGGLDHRVIEQAKTPLPRTAPPLQSSEIPDLNKIAGFSLPGTTDGEKAGKDHGSR